VFLSEAEENIWFQKQNAPLEPEAPILRYPFAVFLPCDKLNINWIFILNATMN
jgi:hypothetical protein